MPQVAEDRTGRLQRGAMLIGEVNDVRVLSSDFAGCVPEIEFWGHSERNDCGGRCKKAEIGKTFTTRSKLTMPKYSCMNLVRWAVQRSDQWLKFTPLSEKA